MEKVAEVKGQVQGNEHKAAVSAEKDAAFKAKKAEAAKAFAARQKERKEMLAKAAKELIDKKLIEKLDPETQKFFQEVANPVRSSGFGGSSFLNKVFGDSPKVGDSVKLIDYMKKTMDSRAKLEKYIKDWAEKGTVIEIKEAQNPLETTYTITKLA